jgi:hypothetical protein
VTNVPFLARGKQADTLKKFIEQNHPLAKTELATAMSERCLGFCAEGATVGLVTPQGWHFLSSYEKFRVNLLTNFEWNLIAKLGPAAFRDMNWWAATTQLSALSKMIPEPDHSFAGFDASSTKIPSEKAAILEREPYRVVLQSSQLANPDARITLDPAPSGELLEKYAASYQGISPADFPHYGRCFWEVQPGPEWLHWQSTVEQSVAYGGRELVLWWNEDLRQAVSDGIAFVRGEKAFGKKGIVVRSMRHLPATLYTGERFDTNVAVIVPHNQQHLPAIWAFCSSPEFHVAVRRIDQKTNVTNATLVKIPFDLAHWQAVADANGPLLEPHSNEPTQWLFQGSVVSAAAPYSLQVALARLLGYRWPDQVGDKLDRFTDEDGIVCLPAIGTEKAAAERLRELLAAAYASDWSPTRQEGLLAAVGFGGKTLHDWLRDGFFEQHCKLFHNRPFLWHIWDGKKDGFSAIVNYHKFCESRLRDLIYHHLAEWIKRQANAIEKGESGADARHAAALELQKKLKLIHEGEKPYDIFVRWKPVDQQPIGWEPDLDDGVRPNIRPFMEADILRKKPNVKWTKDKGRDPESAPWFHLFKGDRINDHHLSLEEKRKARGQGGQP